MKNNNFKKLRHIIISSVFLFIGVICLVLTGCGDGKKEEEHIDPPNPDRYMIRYK